TPELYESIIQERDIYMAAKLLSLSDQTGVKSVLAVVGAGHLKGLAESMKNPSIDPKKSILALEKLPESSKIPWFSLILILVLVFGFYWGYRQGGIELAGTLLLQWVLITGIGGLLGCIAARGHWLSCLAAFISSPITPLHPALSSGMVSAYVEAKMNKPTYQDLLNLRNDTTEIAGWWKNRFARILVNFILTNTGTALAVWIAGATFFIKLGN
nr:TraB/GumN family protein [Arenimonas sp.]